MSSFDRRAFLLMPLALAACGFTPVYGTGTNGGTLQNNVEVAEPNYENAYLLTRRLEERLGRATVPAYRLDISVTSLREALAVNTESNINRYNLLGVADYTLIEQSTGRVVTSGRVSNFTGSSSSGTTVATLSAGRDAQRRLMTLLADQIVARLLSADLT